MNNVSFFAWHDTSDRNSGITDDNCNTDDNRQQHWHRWRQQWHHRWQLQHRRQQTTTSAPVTTTVASHMTTAAPTTTENNMHRRRQQPQYIRSLWSGKIPTATISSTCTYVPRNRWHIIFTSDPRECKTCLRSASFKYLFLPVVFDLTVSLNIIFVLTTLRLHVYVIYEPMWEILNILIFSWIYGTFIAQRVNEEQVEAITPAYQCHGFRRNNHVQRL